MLCRSGGKDIETYFRDIDINKRNRYKRHRQNSGKTTMRTARMNMPSAVMRIFVGLILIGFSGFVLVTGYMQSQRCSAEVTGKVIRTEEMQKRSRTFYRPVFEYEYNGQVYTFAGYYERQNYYSVGQTKQLRIDPDDPTDAYLSGQSNWYAYPIMIIGVAMLAFGIVTVKKVRANRQSEFY